MSDETLHWKGYLACVEGEACVIQSPFISGEDAVFGADSDHTTLAIAAIQLLQSNDCEVTTVNALEDIDAKIVEAATGVEIVQCEDEEAELTGEWDLCIGEDARLVLCRSDADVELYEPEGGVDVDEEFQAALDAAWQSELDPKHVSQGAYVSQQQYDIAASARLSLASQQSGDIMFWPPRQMTDTGEILPTPSNSLSPQGTVLSWTKLSAAGAPSEFAIRAPILGGISTVYIELNDGPKGVFLMVDDEDNNPQIGDSVELVVRRIYAQEQFIRYGLKARAIL